jgi:hypothetical protein
MITTLWDSALNYPQQNSPYQNEAANPGPQGLQIQSSAAANPAVINPVNPGVVCVQVDMQTVQNRGDVVSLELEVQNPAGSAPAAGTILTMWAACASSGSKQPAELLPAALSLACAMSQVPGRTSVFVMPQFYMAARYVYVWFQYSGDGAGSVPLNLRLRCNGKTA